MPGAERPLIIPVFLPYAGCPHRCAFCNQQTVTGRAAPEPETVIGDADAQIKTFLQHPRRPRQNVQIAFYGGNFLGLPPTAVRDLLALVRQYIRSGPVNAVRFSTRPDAITPETLDLLSGHPVAAVEIGVQSMDDRVLARSNRGHTANDVRVAVNCLKERRYPVGAQLMIGLPGEDDASVLAAGRRVIDLAPDFVRIYPTLVLRGSRLAGRLEDGTYAPLTLDAAVARAKQLCRMFEVHSIPVIRMGLQASQDLDADAEVLAGPYHPAFGHLVRSSIFLDEIVARFSEQDLRGRAVVARVHPRSVSQARGLHNANIGRIAEAFGPASFTVSPDPALFPGAVCIDSLPIDNRRSAP